MNIVVLLFLFLALFGIGSWSEANGGAGSTQACVLGRDNVDRCGPTLNDGRYQVPSEGTVIEVRVNNGPVSPESQEGFEIVIDAAGTATITVTPMGSSDDLSDSERTAEQTVRTEEIGEEGVQQVLGELEACGFYYLPQRHEVDPSDLPDGGNIAVLEVTLVDGIWEVFNQALIDPGDGYQFDECQLVLAKRFEIGL